MTEQSDHHANDPNAETSIALTPLERELPANDDEPRMDSGCDAWLAVLGSWILIFNSWGLSNAFGVFQTYYQTVIIPHSSSGSIAWIGSVQSFLTGLTGVLGGWFIDSGRWRLIISTGTTLEVFGMMMTSLGTKYWHFLLSQGICVGLGSGLLAVSSPTIIAMFFERRRLLAGGIASTGGGVSGVIFPIVMRRLFETVGFGWAVRILAFIMLATLSVAFLVIRPRDNVKRPKGPLVRLSWIRDPTYMTFVIAFACVNAALYIPSFFIEEYALSLGVNPSMAFYVLSILNAATTVCRVLPNWLADKYGAINVLIPCTLGTAIVIFSWRATHSLGGLIGASIGWSICSGALISLPPLGIANLTKKPSEYGRRIGLGYTIAAFGALVGNPIAGAARTAPPEQPTVSAVQKEFQGVWFVAGGAVVIATILIMITRYRLAKWAVLRKV